MSVSPVLRREGRVVGRENRKLFFGHSEETSWEGRVVTFRRRIIVAMVPLFALLVVLGGTGTVLIYHLGNRIDRILRENYDSVIYMRDLNEALERIDSSFQFAMHARERVPSAIPGQLDNGMKTASRRSNEHHAARGRGTGGEAD